MKSKKYSPATRTDLILLASQGAECDVTLLLLTACIPEADVGHGEVGLVGDEALIDGVVLRVGVAVAHLVAHAAANYEKENGVNMCHNSQVNSK